MYARLTLGLCLALAGLVLPLSPTRSVLGDAAIIYVDGGATGRDDGSSWMNAYTNLQPALAAAVSGHEIWVAEGVYYPDEGTGQTENDRNACFGLKGGVAVYGGFTGAESARGQRDWTAHPTILSGEIGVTGVITDNVYHVVASTGVTDTAVLDGFTITGGCADDGSPNHTPSNRGGGMLNTGSSPTLVNLAFTGNTAFIGGGGMYNDDSDPTVINEAFSGNVALHGGGGGMFNDDSSPTLINCLITGNRALDMHAGGILNKNAHTTITNCTFSGNQAGDRCGAIYCSGGTVDIANTIAWHDTAGNPDGPELYVKSNALATVTYSDLQGGPDAAYVEPASQACLPTEDLR